MKNGKQNGAPPTEDHEPIRPTKPDAILDAEVGGIRFNAAIQDFKRVTKNHNGKAYKWYASKSWDEWWDEFNTATDKTGDLKYRTAWHFCKVKTKNQWERDLLWEMIGPPPTEDERKRLRAPYLGDWQTRRENGFWAIAPGKIESIKATIKERQDQIAKAESVAPLTIPHMQRWHRLSLQIDKAFGGNPYDPNYSPLHKKNRIRVREYIKLHKAAVQVERQLWETWMRIHGLNPNDANAWAIMAGMVSAAQLGAAGAVVGAQAQQQLDEYSKLDLMLAKDWREKTEMYPGLTPPVAVLEGEVKPNGKDKNGKDKHESVKQ